MLWLKAFHIIAVVCWFAMLFYLPRLFVYHAMSEDQTSRERFKIMERKLYRGIGTPSMIATIVLGFGTAFHGGAWAYYSQASWFWIKMALVALLVVYHFYCGYCIKRFAREQSMPGHVFFRVFNELPVFLLVGAVILVVLKQPT
ncbi:protoporphyrinogen oxidase HemJ [Agaribacterium haliotis]|uniref:protoporphyrinogen oxidase HemJ n=1 Tax=Agaribacterium haliotis TaxID=2013869 RepID=UPI000BB5839C|nr:protoporphyrinogen oxidase HemJ [Agaribacterium haliotis]